MKKIFIYLLLITAFIFVGCQKETHQKNTGTTSLSTIEVSEIKRKVTELKIPVIEKIHTESKINSLIILCHGFSQNKKIMMDEIGIDLFNIGYNVVAFDTYCHGERECRETVTAVENAYIEAKDLQYLVEFYSSEYNLTSDRIALLGASMGGCAIYIYLSRFGNKYTNTAIPIIGTPDLETLIKIDSKVLHLCSDGKGNIIEATNEQYQRTVEIIKKENPIDQWKHFYNINLLMLNGLTDPLVPVAGPITLKDQLSYYQNKCLYISQGGHNLDDTMREYYKKWLLHYMPVKYKN